MEHTLSSKDRLLGTSRFVVGLAIVLNRLFLCAVVLAVPLSWLFSVRFDAMLLRDAPGVDAPVEAMGCAC